MIQLKKKQIDYFEANPVVQYFPTELKDGMISERISAKDADKALEGYTKDYGWAAVVWGVYARMKGSGEALWVCDCGSAVDAEIIIRALEAWRMAP